MQFGIQQTHTEKHYRLYIWVCVHVKQTKMNTDIDKEGNRIEKDTERDRDKWDADTCVKVNERSA